MMTQSWSAYAARSLISVERAPPPASDATEAGARSPHDLHDAAPKPTDRGQALQRLDSRRGGKPTHGTEAIHHLGRSLHPPPARVGQACRRMWSSSDESLAAEPRRDIPMQRSGIDAMSSTALGVAQEREG